MRILMFTRSFSKFPSWEKGKHGPNTHGLHQEKGSCLFPLWTFPTIAPWLVRAKIFSPKSTCKRPKITNSVEQISQIYVRRNPNTGGPYRKNVLVELAGPCRIKGTGEHGGQINVIFYTKRFQLAPDPPFQVGPDPTSPTSQPSPQSLLAERLLSSSLIPYWSTPATFAIFLLQISVSSLTSQVRPGMHSHHTFVSSFGIPPQLIRTSHAL